MKTTNNRDINVGDLIWFDENEWMDHHLYNDALPAFVIVLDFRPIDIELDSGSLMSHWGVVVLNQKSLEEMFINLYYFDQLNEENFVK
jgi:hypothetical protein